jgi:hypothetical protein
MAARRGRLRAYRHFADCDFGARASRSARRSSHRGSTSKSAVSGGFVAGTRENLDALMSRQLDEVSLAVMMIDDGVLAGAEHRPT